MSDQSPQDDRRLRGDSNQIELPDVDGHIEQHLQIDCREQRPREDRVEHDRADAVLPMVAERREQEGGYGIAQINDIQIPED